MSWMRWLLFTLNCESRKGPCRFTNGLFTFCVCSCTVTCTRAAQRSSVSCRFFWPPSTFFLITFTQNLFKANKISPQTFFIVLYVQCYFFCNPFSSAVCRRRCVSPATRKSIQGCKCISINTFMCERQSCSPSLCQRGSCDLVSCAFLNVKGIRLIYLISPDLMM